MVAVGSRAGPGAGRRPRRWAAGSEAFRGGLLRESVSREIPDARGEQGARTVNLLKARCRVSARRASADVENAKLTCPDTGALRELGAALAAGAVSREHLDVARSALKRLPGRVVRERRGEVDHLLTEHARTFDPGGADHLARHLLSVVAPDRADRYDENALDRRHLSVSRPTRPGWSCSVVSSTRPAG